MSRRKTTIKPHLLWWGMGIGAVYWLLESMLHAFVFTPEFSFLQALFAESDPNEIFMRLLIVGLLTGFGYIADILLTRQRQLATQSERLNRLLRFLSEVNQHIQRLKQPQEMFEGICDAAVKLGGFHFAWVGLYDDKLKGIRPTTHSAFSDACRQAVRHVSSEEILPCTMAAQAMATGQPAYCSMADIECQAAWHTPLMQQGCQAAAAFPILEQDKPLGTLAVYADDSGFFHEQEIGILAEAADDISFALTKIEHERQRKQTEQELRKRVEELERFQKATVQREFRIKELREEIQSMKGPKENSDDD